MSIGEMPFKYVETVMLELVFYNYNTYFVWTVLWQGIVNYTGISRLITVLPYYYAVEVIAFRCVGVSAVL